jgi:integrase
MARPRKRGNKDMPANLYRGDGNTWRYRHPVTGKFHAMGIDKAKAVAAARKLNDLLTPEVDLVSKVSGNVKFVEFSEQWFQNKRRKDGKPISKNTKDLYRFYLSLCQEKWKDLSLDAITLLMVNQHLDSLSVVPSNQTRSILTEIFDLAMSKGLCPDNPARLTQRKYPNKVRKRHTLEGLQKIRDAAEPWLKNAIDLALLTTQRRIDIINMKWSDIHDGYLHVAQQKTTDDPEDAFEISEGAGYVRIKIDAELQKVLDRCKDDIDSPFIIHRTPQRKSVMVSTAKNSTGRKSTNSTLPVTLANWRRVQMPIPNIQASRFRASTKFGHWRFFYTKKQDEVLRHLRDTAQAK